MSKAQNPRAVPGGNSGMDDRAIQTMRAMVGRVERLDEQIAALNADKSDVYAEAKGKGLDAATLKKVVRRRRMDPDKREQADANLELYEAALDGMPLPTAPKPKGGK